MLKKKGFSTSFPNEDFIDNQDTISNFKIKKEDFLLDFDDTYEQLNMTTPKGKIIIQGQENHSPFSLKSFSNLSFDYNRPLSPKTHILNIQDNNNNNYSPILKRVNKTISPSLVSSTNRFKNSLSCSSSSPSSSSSSSSSSPRLISTPPIISTPSSPMILTSSLDKFDEILSENEFMSLDNSVTSSSSSPSSSSCSSPIVIKTNATTSTKIVTPSSSPSSSYIEDAPSTPSPSKLFQSLSFKSPCSSPSSSSSSTTTPKSSINGGNIIKKQLFSNKRIQDIKIEKPSTKIDLHPSKLQIKSNLKIKPSLPYNSTEVTANTKTTTSTTTTTNTTIPTLSKNIIKRTSSVGLSPTLSSTQLVNKSSRKSISAATTTTITPHNNNSTMTTKTPSKRSLDTSNLSTPKSTSSTINKAFTTSTTPLKKPRMSMTPLSSSSSSSTTPSKFINPLPSSSSKTTTTITNSKRLSTLSKPSPITPITPTITKTTATTTTTTTTTPNKPTNKRLSTLVNTAQKPRKSYAPPPSSHISDELEQRIQEALLAEANGNYTGGSVLTHSSPQKVEQSEWSPIRKKSTLHDVHACTKKNY
ncbi:hypothetical protein DDB_G0268590 [Dictyostelium discoideum AX4]|uniref:Putative uncharacterized protein DDB_G0268590 n=1 Tax=Dictyostelium discoideum TaxID=44689 RepID=Y6593_DICDI|nr:hypothetical protein DDB_G0268590 [Dictyostelium discoideum AX4]Q55F95.2 RecName: Full=Putative uncharacterized protein DDB_G0268590 [Dictyostelium discoideum]EAL73748.2 hypothetical protein DDB_G0268590 [Dictyostelium discoideum AX4]|eukprot:XP_647638.2 hypothetical protein DDB_G0268590 [Dictyostelium discoideum AX4]